MLLKTLLLYYMDNVRLNMCGTHVVKSILSNKTILPRTKNKTGLVAERAHGAIITCLTLETFSLCVYVCVCAFNFFQRKPIVTLCIAFSFFSCSANILSFFREANALYPAVHIQGKEEKRMRLRGRVSFIVCIASFI